MKRNIMNEKDNERREKYVTKMGNDERNGMMNKNEKFEQRRAMKMEMLELYIFSLTYVISKRVFFFFIKIK